MSTTNLLLHEQIRATRKAKGWTQAQLAVKAKVAVATISYLENAKTQPEWPTVEAVCKALGIDVGDIRPSIRVAQDPYEARVLRLLDKLGKIEQVYLLKTRAENEAKAAEFKRQQALYQEECASRLRVLKSVVNETIRAEEAESLDKHEFEESDKLLEHWRGSGFEQRYGYAKAISGITVGACSARITDDMVRIVSPAAVEMMRQRNRETVKRLLEADNAVSSMASLNVTK